MLQKQGRLSRGRPIQAMIFINLFVNTVKIKTFGAIISTVFGGFLWILSSRL